MQTRFIVNSNHVKKKGNSKDFYQSWYGHEMPFSYFVFPSEFLSPHPYNSHLYCLFNIYKQRLISFNQELCTFFLLYFLLLFECCPLFVWQLLSWWFLELPPTDEASRMVVRCQVCLGTERIQWEAEQQVRKEFIRIGTLVRNTSLLARECSIP